jgi:hypothetical protein
MRSAVATSHAQRKVDWTGRSDVPCAFWDMTDSSAKMGYLVVEDDEDDMEDPSPDDPKSLSNKCKRWWGGSEGNRDRPKILLPATDERTNAMVSTVRLASTSVVVARVYRATFMLISCVIVFMPGRARLGSAQWE